MSAMAIVADLLRRARRRVVLDSVVAGLPIAAVAVALASRVGGAAAAGIVAGVLVGVAALVHLRLRRLDTRWIVRELDRHRPDLEDSSDLLVASPGTLGPLQRLQRSRMEARLRAGPAPELAPAWSVRTILVLSLVSLLALVAILRWPQGEPVTVARVLGGLAPSSASTGPVRLDRATLRLAPPRYTGQPPREQARLDARAPHGTALRWTLRFAPGPRTAALVFHDGRRLALRREGEVWQAQAVLDRPALYRIEVDGAPIATPARRYRLDPVPDRPPQVRVVQPDRGLTLLAPGQRRWTVVFEATDDHGIVNAARLRLTFAQGSGEAVTFRERVETLQGTGPATRRRYTRTLDPIALGLAPGDDLIVQLVVSDRRTPGPQTGLSPSLIVRYPPPAQVETTGLEGLVRKALPAYFRSQRQIIIDAEALLKERPRLEATRYLDRSDGIGVDQRVLRLRYGQFLGEEADEGAPALPTNDAEEPPPDDAHDGEHGGADGHDHGTGALPRRAPVFGEAGGELEAFGHTHDEAEAATLLDPQTRALLKAALDEMWQSELHLRQGHPERALPYAYRALGFIKQVQQASRIYLARVGPELPPIDESRRLSGDRAGLAVPLDPLGPATPSDPTVAAIWRALGEAGATGRPTPLDFAALERWLRANPQRVRDPLAIAAAVDALRESPSCARCRQDLRALLWPLLTRPATPVPRRSEDPTGRRYLDALRREEAP